MIIAIKPVYDRKAKLYVVNLIEDVQAGDIIAVLNSGFAVFDTDNATKYLERIKAENYFVKDWPEKKRQALVEWLEGAVAGKYTLKVK